MPHSGGRSSTASTAAIYRSQPQQPQLPNTNSLLLYPSNVPSMATSSNPRGYASSSHPNTASTTTAIHKVLNSSNYAIGSSNSYASANNNFCQQQPEMPPPATLPPRFLAHEALIARLRERAHSMRQERRSQSQALMSKLELEKEEGKEAEEADTIFPGVISFAEAMNTN
ncbi:hypothetical protein TYRP_008682 [Tyrophagus putrescentiae]|nr:hypothetical protein TYRP_008682 [Tyrophagus putrescentiae]